MDNYSIQITDYLLTQSWQIAVLVAVVAAVTLALKNRSAHVRYLLWLIVLARCIVPPLFTIPLAVLPETEVSEVLTRSEDLIPLALEGRETPAAEAPVSPASLAVSEPTPTAAETTPRLSVRQWLGLGWIIGATLFVLVAATKAMRTEFWLRRERKPLPAGLQGEIEDLFSSLGVKISPKLWLVEGIGQPFVWGLLRGDIYLPANFAGANNAEHRRGVLGHELSHVLRFDAAVNLLQIMAQAAFWFHPFVWWANKRIRAEREKCCDEMTIARLGAEAKDYSKAIVNILISEHESTRPVPMLAVAGPVKNVEERIKTMLRPGKKFYKRPSLVAATIVLLLALLTVPTALVLTARAQTEAPRPETKSTHPLHEATAAGDVDQVKLLISKGADVNEKDKDGWTPLHSAANYGRKDVAELLLAKGANVDVTTAAGKTPLHLAASFGSRFVPELLLAKGANVNARDKAGNTPLHVGAGYPGASKDFLEFFLAKGAEINARNDKGETPLHLVPRTRHQGQDKRRELAADALLANGADINAKDKSGCTPLYMAVGNDQKKVVELFIAKGAAINDKTNDGMTALHRATMVGNKGMVELLLAKGADVNVTQWSGWTSLHYAARAGNNDIVELLISKGGDINAKNIRGETPAHLAVVQNHKDTVNLFIAKGAEVSTIQLGAYIGDLAKVRGFIEKGANVNTQDGFWLTPLDAAAASGQREVVDFLITKGATVNADMVAEGPGTPLHYAADGGSKEVAELLISKGAIVNARNKDGETPLHFAVKRGYKDLAKLLIDSKATVNARDKVGNTPLHYAAQNGHKDVVLLLIDNGADVNAEAPDKSKPLDYAAWSGHKDVVKLLIDKGTNISQVDDDLFYCACMYGHRDLAELLIKKGADVNSKAWGYAPSLQAVWSTYMNKQPDIPKLLDILKLLLDNGADPNAKDRWDWSLLHYAVHYTEGDVDVTRLLLDKGANPNAIENCDGVTPLHLAADKGRKAVVELLLSRGADVNAKNYYGRTPLSYAENLGSNDMDGRPRNTPLTIEAKSAKKEVAELLRKHGAKE